MFDKRVVMLIDENETSAIEIEFKELRKGDKFSLYERDGTPVKDDNGKQIFIASCDAKPNCNGYYSIEVEC